MFGMKIKQLRKDNGMTQSDLANILKCSLSKVAMWETEKRDPTKDDLILLSDVFNVSTDYLLGRTDERNIKKEIKNVTTIAAHRLGGVEQLPDEAIDEINNYIDLMRLKYLKDNK